MNVHHPKKPSDKPDQRYGSLEDGNVRMWFHQARGARALINGCDVRLGVDEPGCGSLNLGEREQVALVFGGFKRVTGEIPVVHLARVMDEQGEPMGYRQITGLGMLNPEQAEAFGKLPSAFRFKEARAAYGRQGQATTDFLKKCLAVGLLRKSGEHYEKLGGAD
jgi:hypothetical protein